MIRFLVVEDQPAAAGHLGSLLTLLGHHVVGQASNAPEALHCLAALPLLPDMLLIDARLRDEPDGFDLPAHLHLAYPGLPFAFFVTQPAPGGPAAGPPSYTVKAAHNDDLFTAFSKALAGAAEATAHLTRRATLPAGPRLAAAMPLAATSLFVRDGKRLLRVQYTDIRWLESEGNYTLLHTRTGEQYSVVAPLRTVEAQLPVALFQRIHKSYVVALDHITSLEAHTAIVGEGHALPIGRTYQAGLMQRLHLLGASLRQEGTREAGAGAGVGAGAGAGVEV